MEQDNLFLPSVENEASEFSLLPDLKDKQICRLVAGSIRWIGMYFRIVKRTANEEKSLEYNLYKFQVAKRRPVEIWWNKKFHGHFSGKHGIDSVDHPCASMPEWICNLNADETDPERWYYLNTYPYVWFDKAVVVDSGGCPTAYVSFDTAYKHARDAVEGFHKQLIIRYGYSTIVRRLDQCMTEEENNE